MLNQKNFDFVCLRHVLSGHFENFQNGRHDNAFGLYSGAWKYVNQLWTPSKNTHIRELFKYWKFLGKDKWWNFYITCDTINHYWIDDVVPMV